MCCPLHGVMYGMYGMGMTRPLQPHVAPSLHPVDLTGLYSVCPRVTGPCHACRHAIHASSTGSQPMLSCCHAGQHGITHCVSIAHCVHRCAPCPQAGSQVWASARLHQRCAAAGVRTRATASLAVAYRTTSITLQTAGMRMCMCMCTRRGQHPGVPTTLYSSVCAAPGPCRAGLWVFY